MSNPAEPAPEQDNEETELYVDQAPPPENFSDAVREAPLTAIVTAFVAGFIMGRLLF